MESNALNERSVLFDELTGGVRLFISFDVRLMSAQKIDLIQRVAE